jgi:hypothetical protein
MMLDRPERTERLLATLNAALPLEVELLSVTLARMRERSPDVPISAREMLFEVTYEPSHGGIICLIRPHGTDNLVATSLTHVRVHPSAPFARAVTAYQRHRLKKSRRKRAARPGKPDSSRHRQV